MPDESSICQTCGACCSHFRVTFHWCECLQRGIDESMLVQVSPSYVCFKGTEATPVRCIHLEGVVGAHVSCRIYDQRPRPCRRLEPGDDKCSRARAAHGLPPLSHQVVTP